MGPAPSPADNDPRDSRQARRVPRRWRSGGEPDVSRGHAPVSQTRSRRPHQRVRRNRRHGHGRRSRPPQRALQGARPDVLALHALALPRHSPALSASFARAGVRPPTPACRCPLGAGPPLPAAAAACCVRSCRPRRAPGSRRRGRAASRMVGVSARGVGRKLAFSSGALPLLHRSRNSNTLTVVMFHRVLAINDERWTHADPLYTITDEQLDQCLEFFGDHYSLVDAEAVRAAARGERPLPARALLVTFDDGWADTYQYALAVLRHRRCPAVVFVVSSAVDSSHAFWQERLLRAWKVRRDPDALATAWRRAGRDGDPPPESWQSLETIRRLISRLRPLVPEARLAIVEQVEEKVPPGRPEMLTRAQLRSLHGAGVEIGAHGVTHEALAERMSGIAELPESKAQLSELLDGASVLTMSFPHGSYDAELLRAATTEYELVFTSDGILNAVVDGRPPPVLGRIEIRAGPIVGADGAVSAELLAVWLFRRSHATVAA